MTPQAPRHSFPHSVPSMIIVYKLILPHAPAHQHQIYCHQTPTTALLTLSVPNLSTFTHLPTLATSRNMASILSTPYIMANLPASVPHGATSFAPRIFWQSLISKPPSSEPLLLLPLHVTPLIAQHHSGGHYFTLICLSLPHLQGHNITTFPLVKQ